MNKSTKAIDKELYEKAMDMLSSGKKVSYVANELGLNWSTVNCWKQRNGRVRKDLSTFDVTSLIKTQQDKENYSYILGTYLGKGFISKCPRTYRITTYINKINTNAIEYTVNSFKKFFTTKTYTLEKSGRQTIDINCHFGKLPYLFPQHNLNKDVNWKIELYEWQKTIIDSNMLIKGFIVSSGLLYLNEDTNQLNVKILHKSSCVIDIIEEHCIKSNFNYNRYYKNNYHIVDILNFNNDEFLDEIKNLKFMSDDSNKLTTYSENFNDRIFENIDTKEKAYWLGFLYSDGNISTKGNRIGFHLAYKDVILLERFCDFVGGDRNRIVSYNNNKTVFYYVYSTTMKDDLANHNLLPDKTHKKEFPLIENRELFLAFFLGVYDGDGSERNSVLTSGNREFLEHCCERLDLDKNKIKFNKNPHGSCYSLYIPSNIYIEILNNYSYSLERKRKTTSKYFPSNKSVKFDKDLISLNTCEDCGNIISKRSTKCKSCSAIAINEPKRKFEISKEELEKLVLEKPMTEIGKMFGVSDNAIRKRCKKLGIELKSMLGHWTKVKYNKL